MVFLRELLSNRPIKARIPFGINERVRIVSIDNKPRKRNGEIERKNTFIKFVQFDEEGNKITSTEMFWWTPDFNSDYMLQNVATQLSQLDEILSAYGIEEELDPTIGYDSEEEMVDELSTKKGLKAFLELVWELFNEAMEDKVGPDSALFNFKLVTDYKGKFDQLPESGQFLELFVEPADRDEEYELSLKLSPKDVQAKLKGAEPDTATADPEGNKPPEETLGDL